MGFAVKIGDSHFVKRTARFGPFHGSIVITLNAHEARIWSLEKHAHKAGRVLEWRRANYNFDAKKLPPGPTAVVRETELRPKTGRSGQRKGAKPRLGRHEAK